MSGTRSEYIARDLGGRLVHDRAPLRQPPGRWRRVRRGRHARPSKKTRVRGRVPAEAAAVQADGSTAVPTVRNASLAYSTSPERPATLAPGNPAAWNTLLPVQECSQVVYPDGGEVWCSPTSTSMVLALLGRRRAPARRGSTRSSTASSTGSTTATATGRSTPPTRPRSRPRARSSRATSHGSRAWPSWRSGSRPECRS